LVRLPVDVRWATIRWSRCHPAAVLRALLGVKLVGHAVARTPMAGHRMSRPMVMAGFASCTCVLVGVTARTNNQLDAPWGTDRRYTWSGRNSVGGQRQYRNRSQGGRDRRPAQHMLLHRISLLNLNVYAAFPKRMPSCHTRHPPPVTAGRKHQTPSIICEHATNALGGQEVRCDLHRTSARRIYNPVPSKTKNGPAQGRAIPVTPRISLGLNPLAIRRYGDQPHRSTAISDPACQLLAVGIPHPMSNGLAPDDRSLCSARVSNADHPCNGGHRISVAAEPFRVPSAVAVYTPVAGQQPLAAGVVRFAAVRTKPIRPLTKQQVRREPGLSW
jgi:hypothetical protein